MKSSSRTKSHSRSVQISTSLICDWALPRVADITALPGTDHGTATYNIMGTLGTERADASHWRNLPHLALANLPTSRRENGNVDPTAVQSFTKRYGLIRGWLLDEALDQINERRAALHQDPIVGYAFEETHVFSKPRFVFPCMELANAQHLLQTAWRGGDKAAVAVKELEKQAALGSLIPRAVGIEFRSSVEAGGIELRVNNLWSYICLLFLSDYAKGDTGICANPECPAPYFLKKRRTQKYCEAGECVAWAQRQAALKWWRREHGKPTRRKQK